MVHIVTVGADGLVHDILEFSPDEGGWDFVISEILPRFIGSDFVFHVRPGVVSVDSIPDRS